MLDQRWNLLPQTDSPLISGVNEHQCAAAYVVMMFSVSSRSQGDSSIASSGFS